MPIYQLILCSSCTDEEEAQYQLDVDLSTLTFTHHPLFSKEHVLASRLHQHYKQYTERRRKALSFHFSDKVLWISHVLHVSCILNQYMYINCHWMFIHTIVLMVQCQLPKGLMEAHLILFCVICLHWRLRGQILLCYINVDWKGFTEWDLNMSLLLGILAGST